jgi:hypothetical protein
MILFSSDFCKDYITLCIYRVGHKSPHTCARRMLHCAGSGKSHISNTLGYIWDRNFQHCTFNVHPL